MVFKFFKSLGKQSAREGARPTTTMTAGWESNHQRSSCPSLPLFSWRLGPLIGAAPHSTVHTDVYIFPHETAAFLAKLSLWVNAHRKSAKSLIFRSIVIITNKLISFLLVLKDSLLPMQISHVQAPSAKPISQGPAHALTLCRCRQSQKWMPWLRNLPSIWSVQSWLFLSGQLEIVSLCGLCSWATFSASALWGMNHK